MNLNDGVCAVSNKIVVYEHNYEVVDINTDLMNKVRNAINLKVSFKNVLNKFK